MKPNNFAEKTLRNEMFLNDNINNREIYILSRNITDEQNQSKINFINKYFNNPKIKYISVGRYESKADVMKRVCPTFDAFFDDELTNIKKVAEAFESLEGKEFIIPEYGYNKMPIELRILIETKGGTIKYYNPFKK